LKKSEEVQEGGSEPLTILTAHPEGLGRDLEWEGKGITISEKDFELFAGNVDFRAPNQAAIIQELEQCRENRLCVKMKKPYLKET
jgi:hypothetical protein